MKNRTKTALAISVVLMLLAAMLIVDACLIASDIPAWMMWSLLV